MVCDRHKNNETGPLACVHIRGVIRDSGPSLPVAGIIARVVVDGETVGRCPMALCGICSQRHSLSGDLAADFFADPAVEDLVPVCRQCFNEYTTGWAP